MNIKINEQASRFEQSQYYIFFFLKYSELNGV